MWGNHQCLGNPEARLQPSGIPPAASTRSSQGSVCFPPQLTFSRSFTKRGMPQRPKDLPNVARLFSLFSVIPESVSC